MRASSRRTKKATSNTPEAAKVPEKFKRAHDKHGIGPGAITKDISS